MSKHLTEIVSTIKSLEPFPHIATQVLGMASKPQVVPDELIQLIQTDPGITGKVLKLSNSSFYGFQREIASVQEAGNLLGVRTLVNLVLTSCAGKYFRNYGAASGGKDSAEGGQGDLWKRCMTIALASRIISMRHNRVDPDRAYTAGLLLNVGSLVLDRFYRDGSAAVSAEVERGRDRIDAERRVLGVHHAEIGARLSTRWDLPAIMVDTIRFHHSPEKAKVDKVLAATVHLAETVCAAHRAGEDADNLKYEVSQAAYELTGLSEEDFESIDASLETEIERAADLFAAQ